MVPNRAKHHIYMIAVYHTWFEGNEILTCQFTPTIKTRVTKKMYHVINFIQWLEENTQTTFSIKMWSNMFQLPSFNFICLGLTQNRQCWFSRCGQFIFWCILFQNDFEEIHIHGQFCCFVCLSYCLVVNTLTNKNCLTNILQ